MQFLKRNVVLIALFSLGLLVAFSIIKYYFGGFFYINEPIEISVQEVSFIPEGQVTIYQQGKLIKKIEIEFARTESERELGLMYRHSMKENRGMFFIFPDEKIRSFYMKNTEFYLDIIYINSQGKIIDIIERAIPYDETPLPSSSVAQYVLEVNGGMASKWGIKVGDIVKFQ